MDKRLGIHYSPQLVIPQSPLVLDFLRSKEMFTVASGPRNCSKSLTSEWYLFQQHDRTPGLQSAIIRTEQRTLKSTVLPHINNKVLRYPITDKRQPFTYNKADMKIEFDNGGTMHLFGMDDGKILGAELHIMLFNQIEQYESPEGISNALGCMTNFRAGTHLRDRDGNPFYRFIGDANPSTPYHWLKEWEKEGIAKFYDFTHKDHPYCYDWEVDDYTDYGKQTIDDLLKAYPPGYMRERMVFGKWEGAAGRVYKLFNEAEHTRKMTREEFDDTWEWYGACDFGGTSPCAAGIVAVKDDKICVFKEIHKVYRLIQDFIADFEALRKRYNIPKLNNVWLDHTLDCTEQFRDAGINAQNADKEKLEGIEDVKTAFGNNEIEINTLSLDDPDGSRPGKPNSLVKELLSYSHKPESKMTGSHTDDEPIKGDDHAVDWLRYLVRGLKSRPKLYHPLVTRIKTKRRTNSFDFV